ncbi:toxin ParE1/3/4 [Rhizobium sp. SG_E_25_P2]|uniref:type II toxin-antitoxin system RelE/ParE family toxin n=1 Tax=Rhizobium sp. SG_E_25_P2 TaxID=2879942 RepID=UPI002475535D|nr:type II toxin-antitoxin system RelE/ParE family toxin [Rhizobium sp. SG_E_25_P2]MDH6267287.1 toxin ParE1/3/4 [Rhizobium sp. SG_E_25_P2]
MTRFRLTRTAAADLRSIGHYTEAKWGRKQRNAYLRAMNARFLWLAENPHLGRRRDDVREGCFSFAQGQHLIFYRLGAECIEILPIPQARMDHPLRVP